MGFSPIGLELDDGGSRARFPAGVRSVESVTERLAEELRALPPSRLACKSW